MIGIFFFSNLNLSRQRNNQKYKEKGKRSSRKSGRKNEQKTALLPEPHENVCVLGTEIQVNERFMEKLWINYLKKSVVERGCKKTTLRKMWV